MNALSAARRRFRSITATRGAATLAVTAGLCTLASGPAATVTSAEPGAAAPPYGTIWVANTEANSLEEFAPGATGNVAPEATIAGFGTFLSDPSSVAIDSQGRVWATSGNDAITAYGPQDSGPAIPALSISGPRTTIDAPDGIAISPAGDVWIVSHIENTILEFAAGSYGNVAPTRSIAGSNTDLYDVIGIALSPDGKHVWVSEDSTAADTSQPPALEEFATSANGDAKPTARIAGSRTQLDETYGVTVNAANQPIADNDAAVPNSLVTFAAGAHGNATPIRTLSGANTALDDPSLLALDAKGSTWLAITGDNAVKRFGPAQHGNVTALQDIVGASTGLNDPEGVAVFGTPPGAPRSVRSHHAKTTLHLAWTAPKVTGGGILGYAVRSSHSKSGHWTTVATTTKPAYTKRHAKPKLYYDVEAFNDKGYSPPTRAIRPKV